MIEQTVIPDVLLLVKRLQRNIKTFIGDNKAMQEIVIQQFNKQGLGEEEILLQRDQQEYLKW